MSIGKETGSGNHDADWRARRLEAVRISADIIAANAQLQASLGLALKTVRRLKDALQSKQFDSEYICLVANSNLEHVGADASVLARAAVRMQDVLEPPKSWRDVLRDSSQR